MTWVTKNQVNMTPAKKTNKAPVSDPKEMYIYKLPAKEFKIVILKKLNEIQESTDRKLNKIKKTTYEQSTEPTK